MAIADAQFGCGDGLSLDVVDGEREEEEDEVAEEESDDACDPESDLIGHSHSSGFTRNCGGGNRTVAVGIVVTLAADGDVTGASERRRGSGGKGSGMAFLVVARSIRNSRGGG